MINKLTNLTINGIGKNLNRTNVNDVQVQFVGDLAWISHQNLLRIREIRIRHKEVPVLHPPMEPSISANNQLNLTISIGFVQALQALMTPTTDEVITFTTVHNTVANMTPWRVISTGIDGTLLDLSRSEMSAVASCPSTTPPSGCIWNGSIGNTCQTTIPNFRNFSELNAPTERRFTNDSILLSARSQILHDKF